jgi:hypothetical protein
VFARVIGLVLKRRRFAGGFDGTSAIASLPVRTWRIGGSLIAVILTAWIGFIAFTEQDFPLFALVSAFFAALVVLLSVISRRPGFGLAIAIFAFLAVYVTSAFKFDVAAMNLHVYDVIFYLFSFAQLSFFIQTYGATAAMFGAIIAVTLLLMAVSFKLETPRRFGAMGGLVAIVLSLAESWRPQADVLRQRPACVLGLHRIAQRSAGADA